MTKPERMEAMLEDIAVLTGGRLVTEDLGIKLENVQLADLGRAKRVAEKLQERLAKLVGGVALLRCVAALDEMKLEGDQAVGVSIVRRALEEPIRQIVVNAGVEGAVIVMEVKKNKKAAYGFNAASEEYKDMIAAGVIDPTKVTRTALQSAASIAGPIITTECVIADKPEDDKKMGGMPPTAV